MPYDDFYRNDHMLDKHLSWCKPCNAVRYGAGMRRRANMLRDYIQAIKVERGCADCGYNAHPAALDFDHLPGHVKVRKMSTASAGMSRVRLEAEMAKCEVVCANCHRVRTANRRILKEP